MVTWSKKLENEAKFLLENLTQFLFDLEEYNPPCILESLPLPPFLLTSEGREKRDRGRDLGGAFGGASSSSSSSSSSRFFRSPSPSAIGEPTPSPVSSSR